MENSNKFYSISELRKKYKISMVLLEYLGIDIIKKGNNSYINQTSFDKIMKFKSEHPNTKNILFEYTFMKKYGVRNPQQLKEIQDKKKVTMIERYGVENPSQSEQIKQKKIKTLQTHFGNNVTNPMDAKEVVEKIKHNWTTKSQDEINSYISKNKFTKKQRYGNENYNNAENISKTKHNRTQNEIDSENKKSKQTRFKKYGNENYNNREQITKTMIAKTGKGSITNSKKAMKTKIKNNTVVCKINYKYNNLIFASSWELYYYIYQKEILHNDIQKGKIFEYEFNDSIHIYECDFLVNNKNIEIKGSQYLDDKGKLYFPYSDYKDVNAEEKQKQWTAKQKCMEENNVKVISKEEIEPIIKIIKDKFGKNYINQFKIK